jgi:Mrp family chromosome partitioning ATPase
VNRALQETGQEGLWFLASGEPIPSGKPWPTSDAMRSVLRQLRHHFDWILVDGPAWDGGPEMVALAACCDTVYLVVRPDMVQTPAVDELARLIPPLGSELGGYIVMQR